MILDCGKYISFTSQNKGIEMAMQIRFKIQIVVCVKRVQSDSLSEEGESAALSEAECGQLLRAPTLLCNV